MSAVDRAERRESAAYVAMVHAQAELIARQTEQDEYTRMTDPVTERMRRRAASKRREWESAYRALEDVMERVYA